MELQLRILSFCDAAALRGIESSSNKWHQIVDSKELWRSLFMRHFPEELPLKESYKEAFRKRASPIPLDSPTQLKNAITSFFCMLKWNTKREFHCLFFNASPCFIKIQQGFGPERGTPKGFEGPADEIDYFEYTGPLGNSLSEEESDASVLTFEKATQCPGDKFHWGTKEVSPPEGESIPVFISSIRASSADRFGFIQDWTDLNGLPFVDGEITEKNVGCGNTLGYFSELNDWKFSFSFFSIQGNTGSPVWIGRIPFNSRFKFIFKDLQDNITWEKRALTGDNENRKITVSSAYDISGHHALEDNLRCHPIQFA